MVLFRDVLALVVCALAFHAPAVFGDTGDLAGSRQALLSVGQDGVVRQGQRLCVPGENAILVQGSHGGIVIIRNFGVIEQPDAARAIRAVGLGADLLLHIDNAEGALISSVNNDALKTGKGVRIRLDNQGRIHQQGDGINVAQALDCKNADGGPSTIVNGSLDNRCAMIIADGGDAIRPGCMTHITNYGAIISRGRVNTSFPRCFGIAPHAPSAADGIDSKTEGLAVDNFGLVKGARHGITARQDLVVRNASSGEIIGLNGSGVGSDAGGRVCNHGSIIGAYAGEGKCFEQAAYAFPATSSATTCSNGDGDGVDIDGIADIENFGVIRGDGAGGFDSSGMPNGSEGVAVGGGRLVNHEGAIISAKSVAVLVDDGLGGSGGHRNTPGRGTVMVPGSAMAIINRGELSGGSAAMRLVGPYDDSLVNSGKITGDLFFGGCDDLMTLEGGAAMQGVDCIDGGDGGDAFCFSGWLGALSWRFINWERIILANGSVVTLLPAQGGVERFRPEASRLRIDATSRLCIAGGHLLLRLEGGMENAGTLELREGAVLELDGDYCGDGGVVAVFASMEAGAIPVLRVRGELKGQLVLELVVERASDFAGKVLAMIGVDGCIDNNASVACRCRACSEVLDCRIRVDRQAGMISIEGIGG